MEDEKKLLYTCHICGRLIKQNEYMAVRTEWLNNHGFVAIPPEEIVHVKCDRKEQARIAHLRDELKLANGECFYCDKPAHLGRIFCVDHLREINGENFV